MLEPKIKELETRNKLPSPTIKGRLTQEEIERKVKEAEDAAEDDKRAKGRVEAKNQLENYVYQIRNIINDEEKLANKLSEEDKETLETAIKDTLEWIEQNPTAEQDEFDTEYKALEKVVQPIFTKFYGSSGGSQGGSDNEDMPSHDEL